MDMFFWFLIAIAVVAYLISGAKRKRKGGVYRRKTDYQPPKREVMNVHQRLSGSSL